MKDSEAKLIVLNHVYQHRRRAYTPGEETAEIFPNEGENEFHRICEQLVQTGLVKWQKRSFASFSGGWVTRGTNIELTAAGISVVETERKESNIPLTPPVFQSIHIQNSPGIQIGSHNTQNLQNSIEYLAQKLNSADASEEEKTQAKDLISSALSHPLISAIVGGSVPALIELFR